MLKREKAGKLAKRSTGAIVGLMLLLALTIAAQEPNNSQHVIDLKAIGYPQPPCDGMFQVDYYGKNHVEFLDSERLLVSFPADTSGCDKKDGYGGRTARKFRTVVLDLFGRVLHSFDWDPEADVQPGPDGHILMLTGVDIRILDADFSLRQVLAGIRPALAGTVLCCLRPGMDLPWSSTDFRCTALSTLKAIPLRKLRKLMIAGS